MTYNGWANRETWLAYTWLTDDSTSPGLPELASIAAECSPEKLEQVVEACADSVMEEGESQIPNAMRSLLTNLLNDALEEINWRELAEVLTEGK